MTNLPALTKREFTAYFYSPMAYVIATGYLIFSGLSFYILLKDTRDANAMRNLLTFLGFIHTIFVPMVTMRLIAEERKTGTLEMLVTAPVSDVEIALSKFLGALGIRLVGESTARDLANHFADIHPLMDATVEKLQEVPEVGERVATVIHDFFQTKGNRRLVERLLEAGLNWPKPKKVEGGKFQGMKFVFTGELVKLARREAEAKVAELGGKAASSVSKNTDYVVAGPSAGSKLDKAKALGVKIIDETEFLKMAGM